MSIASLRYFIALNAFSYVSIPLAAIAAYSPRECPATADASMPFDLAASSAISDIASIAGCEIIVRESSFSSPPNILAARSKPRISLPSSITFLHSGMVS